MQPRQLVVLGDSGVQGWGDREEGGWCQRLRMEWMCMPDAPIVYPLGVRGDGLERVAARWYQEWSCRGELRRHQPDAVLLSVGLNDTARIGRPDGRPQLDIDAVHFGMGQLLADIRRRTRVFVLGLTPVDEQLMPFADCLWYSNSRIQDAEAALSECCREADVPFLPLIDGIQQQNDWLHWIEPDGIHLNAEGHRWIHQQLQRWQPLMEWAGFGGKVTASALRL